MMHRGSLLLKREPHWRLRRKGMACNAPGFVCSWIDEKGSLTARLSAVSGSKVGVSLLRQGWYQPFPTEAFALDLPLQRRVWLREVMLHAQNKPLVLARTVVPAGMLRGVGHGLARLGDRPLGELLFAYRRLDRRSLEQTRVDASNWQPAMTQAHGLDTPVWGRRSLYETMGLKLLVCEFFFPALFDWADSQK